MITIFDVICITILIVGLMLIIHIGKNNKWL